MFYLYNGLGLFLSDVAAWRLMEKVLYLMPMAPPKRFGILEALDAFRFFIFRHYYHCILLLLYVMYYIVLYPLNYVP